MSQVYEVYDAASGEFCGFEEKTGQGALGFSFSLSASLMLVAGGWISRDMTFRS